MVIDSRVPRDEADVQFTANPDPAGGLVADGQARPLTRWTIDAEGGAVVAGKAETDRFVILISDRVTLDTRLSGDVRFGVTLGGDVARRLAPTRVRSSLVLTSRADIRHAAKSRYRTDV